MKIYPVTIEELKEEMEKFESIGYTISIMELIPYESPLHVGEVEEDNLEEVVKKLNSSKFELIISLF